MTQEQMALRTGKDRATIANFLRLLKLPIDVQSRVESGELSFGHARALLGLNHHPGIEKAAKRVVRTFAFCSPDREPGAEHAVSGWGKKEPKPEPVGRSECEGSGGAAAAGAGPEGEDRGQQGARPGDYRVRASWRTSTRCWSSWRAHSEECAGDRERGQGIGNRE